MRVVQCPVCGTCVVGYFDALDKVPVHVACSNPKFNEMHITIDSKARDVCPGSLRAVMCRDVHQTLEGFKC